MTADIRPVFHLMEELIKVMYRKYLHLRSLIINSEKSFALILLHKNNY